MKKDQEELFNLILPKIDDLLVSRDYICGNEDPSIVDIQYYVELSTVMNLTFKKIEKKDYPNLYAWFVRIRNLKEVQESYKKFKDLLQKHQVCKFFVEDEYDDEEEAQGAPEGEA